MAHVNIHNVLEKAPSKAYTSQYSNRVGVIIPKKVIRALHNFHSETPYQLSFQKGDFFHVIGNEEDNHWWEATNPMTQVRGMVPVSYFEVIDKKKISGSSDSKTSPRVNRPRNSSNAQPAILGHVLYDFESQSPEELSAEAGDHVIIVGKSNNEWLIAKHIGKLGGLGLLPSSYVEIKDARTGLPIVNINEFLEGMLPGSNTNKHTPVVEQKNEVRFHEKAKVNGVSIDTSFALRPNNSQTSIEGLSPREQATRAGVSTYFKQDECYYFEVQITLLDGHNRVLYKLYEDFYDFHVALLKAYPKEAGSAGQYRIIPYMPGPVTLIDESITIRRCHELNIYVKQLFGLPKYIQESKVLREFFGLEEPGEDEANVARKRIVSNRRPSQDDAEVPDQNKRTTSSSTSSDTSISSAVPSIESVSTPLSDIEPFTPVSMVESNSEMATLIKVKIQYEEDLIAIRVPSCITYDALHSKIAERLEKHSVSLRYRSGSSDYVNLNSQRELQNAWSNGKLFVYAS
ncbi:bud emergence protein 1 [Basidiobolus ranarum]|uniref:Bud emergence protein 1 n=1 Tax=Basidiobolus ranarum TaxID=34480 RepID=A0ABR2WMA6_9FUNG